jgi:hypothetical protein
LGRSATGKKKSVEQAHLNEGNLGFGTLYF